MKKISLLIVSALLIVILSACGTAASGNSDSKGKQNEETLTITHELGETKVKKNPKNVVVFDFGSLDTLDKLGVKPAGVPQANVPSYLSKYEGKDYENVGGLKEPDFEKVNELEPDLIIISGRQADFYEEFSEIAPTIYLGVDTQNYMESFKKNAGIIGQIFGKEDQVKEELAKIDNSVSELKKKAESTGKNALVVLANEGKISAFGPNSRYGVIHEEFGVTPVDQKIEASAHGQIISNEYIVEKNPDYLFVVDRTAAVGGETSAKTVVENNMVKTTDAYKNSHIVYLDPDCWYLSGGGLESVAMMVKEVSEGLGK